MNQNPELPARHRIDEPLIAGGCIIQNKSSINRSQVLPFMNIRQVLALPIIFSSSTQSRVN
jgi:hypothetical protein